MAREASVTQEQINATADAIRATGAKPTARAVRDQIGSGSMATILRLLQVWQAGQIKPAEQVVMLPPALQRALVDFIGQEVATAKAGLEADLVGCQGAQADLICESERQASTIELQAEALEASQAVQAGQAGRMGQLEADLSRAGDDVHQERLAAEAARTELAKALLRLEGVPRLEADLTAARAELATERQARAAGEQAAAVAIAELKASERRAGELEQRVANAEAQIKELRAANKAAAAEAREATQAQAHELGAVRASLDEAREALGAERVEATQLRGRLATFEAQALATD